MKHGKTDFIAETPQVVTRMEIEERMDEGREVLPSTILSLLSRLEERGFVEREKRESDLGEK